MASPKYGYAHRKTRAAWVSVAARGEATCAEDDCLHDDRTIHPDQTWHLAHDPTGTIVIGVSHERCNTSEGATRGNAMRGSDDALAWFE